VRSLPNSVASPAMASTPPTSQSDATDATSAGADVQADAVAQRLAQEKTIAAAAAAQHAERERQEAHDAALAHAVQANDEAKAATKERDAAAQRASDALAQAAMERAATAVAIAPESSSAPSGGTRCLIYVQPCFTTKLWLSSNSTLRPLRSATSRTTSPPSSTSILVISVVGAINFSSSSASFRFRTMSARIPRTRSLLIGLGWTASSSLGSSPRSPTI